MRILHAYNRHRGGGGSDNAWDTTIRISIDKGFDVGIFAKNSGDLPPGLNGKVRAFFSGIYARDAVREFDLLLSEFRPEVVHAHELYPLISPWILPKCTKAGIPVVVTCYDFRLTCPVATHFNGGRLCHRCLKGGEYWAVFKNCRKSLQESLAFAIRNMVARKFHLFTSHTSCFIVLTDFSRRWLIDMVNISAERIVVNPCAIELPEKAADPAKGQYIAFAGRFVQEKGIEVLVEAARKTGLPLKLAGDASIHSCIKQDDNIEFVRTSSPKELADFYRGARALIVPSIWYETFSIVAAESMSHGIPVIASRIGALQDTVEDGVTGLLFKNQNVEDLAQKLNILWHDNALCRRLGAEARKKVQKQYSEETHFNQLIQAYDYAKEHIITVG